MQDICNILYCLTIFHRRILCKSTYHYLIISTIKNTTRKDEGVSKFIPPLFYPPLFRLSHNSLFTAAMLLISNKIIC